MREDTMAFHTTTNPVDHIVDGTRNIAISICDWAFHPKNQRSTANKSGETMTMQKIRDPMMQDHIKDIQQIRVDLEQSNSDSLLIRDDDSLDGYDHLAYKPDDVLCHAEDARLFRVWESSSSSGTSRSTSPAQKRGEDSASDTEKTPASSPVRTASPASDEQSQRCFLDEQTKNEVVGDASSADSTQKIVIIHKVPDVSLVLQFSTTQNSDSINWDQLVDNLAVVFHECLTNPPPIDGAMAAAEIAFAKALFGAENLSCSSTSDALALAINIAPHEFREYQKRAEECFITRRGTDLFRDYNLRRALIRLTTKIEDQIHHRQHGWDRLIKAIAEGSSTKELQHLRTSSKTIFDPYCLPILSCNSEEEAAGELSGLVITTKRHFRAKHIDKSVKRTWKRKYPDQDCIRSDKELRIRYPGCNISTRRAVDGVPLPTRVFELGSLEYRSESCTSARFDDILYSGLEERISKSFGEKNSHSNYLACVDLDHPDRPLWLVRDSTVVKRPAEWNNSDDKLYRHYVFDDILDLDEHGPELVLLMKKFPQSAQEWEKNLLSETDFVKRCRSKSVSWLSSWIEPVRWPVKDYSWEDWFDSERTKAEKKWMEWTSRY